MNGSKIAVIGDIHGCSLELKKLLIRLALGKNDKLILIGDLIDKGPNSPKVVKRLAHLAKEMEIVLVMGNHEEQFLRWLRKDPSKRKALKRHQSFEQLNKELCDEDRAFLSTAVLYHKFQHGHAKYLAVHAGIPSGITSLPDEPEEVASFSNKQRRKYYKMYNVRFERGEEGRFVQMGQELDTDVYWAHNYEKNPRFGCVFFGHQPFVKAPIPTWRHSINIDHGCVHGGNLAAYVLDGDEVNVFFEKGQEYLPLMRTAGVI